MKRLVESDLDDYTRFAVRLILARFPAWEGFATVRPQPDGKGGVIDFNVPCSSPEVEQGLWVSTADEELTVGFHTHHHHFTDYEERLNPTQIEAGLDYAADILSERVGVVSWYRRGKFVGSRSVVLPVEGPLPSLWEGMGLVGAVVDRDSSDNEGTLRSWSGRYDRDVGRV